jgi:hypothetical protein
MRGDRKSNKIKYPDVIVPKYFIKKKPGILFDKINEFDIQGKP